MLYLLDANTFIDANRDYYPIESVPEFWEWISHQAQKGNVKIPTEIYEEITSNDEAFSKWMKNSETKSSILYDKEIDVSLVQRVLDEGYAPDLTDTEVEKLGRDPFLVAYALEDPENIRIVTFEADSTKERANKKIPQVCHHFGIESINLYELNRRLEFSTNWKTKVQAE